MDGCFIDGNNDECDDGEKANALLALEVVSSVMIIAIVTKAMTEMPCLLVVDIRVAAEM